MNFGWTGTRYGMTEKQFNAASNILLASDLEELHHGDCVGSDAEAHSIVLPRASMGLAKIVIHPPVDEEHRAFCKDHEICVCTHSPKRHEADPRIRVPLGECWGNSAQCKCKQYERRTDQVLWLPPKTHLARNRDIVDATGILIATPYGMHEEVRGGTWYTINYARKKGKWLCIIWPDGTLKFENVPE